jgi:hypothetical protein
MFFAPRALGGARTRLFTALLVPSVALALLGTYNPWPPVSEGAGPQNPVIARVTNPIAANLAALLEERLAGTGAAERAEAALLPLDPRSRRLYLSYFYASKEDEERSRRYKRGPD